MLLLVRLFDCTGLLACVNLDSIRKLSTRIWRWCSYGVRGFGRTWGAEWGRLVGLLSLIVWSSFLFLLRRSRSIFGCSKILLRGWRLLLIWFSCLNFIWCSLHSVGTLMLPIWGSRGRSITRIDWFGFGRTGSRRSKLEGMLGSVDFHLCWRSWLLAGRQPSSWEQLLQLVVDCWSARMSWWWVAEGRGICEWVGSLSFKLLS